MSKPGVLQLEEVEVKIVEGLEGEAADKRMLLQGCPD